jgi:hypothetical protein
MMTDGFKRIENDVQAFCEKVAQCGDKDNSNMQDFRDAFGRMGRTRDRFLYERETLEPSERAAFEKVFENDKFMEGMGEVRNISEHVEKGDVTLSRLDNSTFTITAKSSAAAMFADRVVYLTDTDGFQQRWDHNEQLNEAARRINSALGKAKL